MLKWLCLCGKGPDGQGEMNMVKDRKWNRWSGKALVRLLSVLMVVGVTGTPMCALADGTGPFGYPNLLANPDFEHATIAANSNSGNWGRFK